MASLLKLNKENFIDLSLECRVVLEDVLLEVKKKSKATYSVQPSTSSAQSSTTLFAPPNETIPTQAESLVPTSSEPEPDIVEVIDVEEFEKNGLKVRPRLNPIQQLTSTMRAMNKQIKALQARIDSLQNAPTTSNVIATNSQNHGTISQPSNDDEPIDIDGEELNISAIINSSWIGGQDMDLTEFSVGEIVRLLEKEN